MALSRPETAALRNYLYNLKTPCIALQRKAYEETRYQYIKAGEGEKLCVYNDGRQNLTVAIGFNMSRPEAYAEWQEIFKNLSFEQVYKGQRHLTSYESQQLFNYSVTLREKELERLYAGNWPKLTLNERLAIEDAYFNCPALVQAGSRFYRHIKEYTLSRNVEALKGAVYELEKRSNPLQDKGIENRRISQAEMLATYSSRSIQHL